ncbi:MAG: histidine phosphatase family protein [Pseudomonadota bacterium]
MTRFWLVRHGPTHEKAITGWRDVPADLTDTAALERLAAFLPAQAVIVSSDLQRCTATAAAIAAGRQTLVPQRALREFDFGDWDGKTFPDIDAIDPALSRKFWEGDPKVAPPNGESWEMVTKRVQSALVSLAETQAAPDIIVVGHMGMIMTMIAVCGRTPHQAMSHKIDNLSVTDMTYDRHAWRIGTINRRI